MKPLSCADIAAPGHKNIECKRERNQKCQGEYPSRLWMTTTKIHVPYYQSFLELWGKESNLKETGIPYRVKTLQKSAMKTCAN